MRAISRSKSTGSSGCLVRFVGFVFLLVGCGMFVGLSVLPVMRWYAGQGWAEVDCRILSSAVGRHSSTDGGDTFSVDIRYVYEWDGAHYESDRYNFFGGSSSGYDRKQAVVERYPAGQTRTCFVDPENPSEAVLSREFSLVYLIGCFGLIFVFISFFLLFHRKKTVGVSREQAPIASLARASRYTVSSGAGALPEAGPEHGTITLKGGNNSVVGFLFLLVFGLIWNGVVLSAVWSNVSSVGGGAFDILGTIFLVPFVLIGLALIGGTGYFFLTLFNPRPDLTLTPGYLPLGSSAVLGWSFRGNASRIRSLTITVQGQEAATYQRGTSTTTDRSIFEKLVVVETSESALIAQGEVQFTVPEFTVPSFDAPNNKIEWQVKVHGDIHRWPDVNETFALVVAPLPLEGAGTPQAAEFHQTGSGGF